MKRWKVVALALLMFGGFALVLAVPGGADWFGVASGGSGNSMSHGPTPQAGILDNGDLGNYQRNPPPGDIRTMYAAREAGAPPLAGDHGDVLVFRANGHERTELGRRLLVEHRAIAWVAFDEASGLFDIPELGLDDVAKVTFPEVGLYDAAANAYVHKPLTLVLAEYVDGAWTYPAGQHSGWITKGDHNRAFDQHPGPDGTPLSTLVQPAWVESRLLRVVDQEMVTRDAVVGTLVVVLLGVAYFLAKRAYAAPPPRPRLPLQGDDPWEPLPRERRLGPALGRVAQLVRAACDACGTAWGEMAFCARCGAERNPKNRYASREAREAAALRARRR